MEIITQQISPIFTKHILDLSAEGWHYYQPMLHHFTGPDTGNPHNHPWSFTTTILKGGYREKVYNPAGDDGSFWTEIIDRLPGQTHQVKHDCIHQVIELFEKDCWTIVVPGDGPGNWRHFSFDPDKEIK